jgi:formylmethanofuran dehydrogenase subunit E
MVENKDEFERLLQKAAELRGHLCVGLPLGLKMAQMGLKLLNMTEAEKRKPGGFRRERQMPCRRNSNCRRM